MNLLARREHSRLELHRKMRRHFDEPEIDEALQRLGDQDLQSDQRFAESFSRDRMLRGQGPQRIALELRRRGVAAHLIDSIIDSLPREAQTSWRTLAKEALYKKFGAGAPDSLSEKARRQRFLEYRGFGEQARDIFYGVAD